MKGRFGQPVPQTIRPNRIATRRPHRHRLPPILFPNQIALPLRHDASPGVMAPRLSRARRREFAGRTRCINTPGVFIHEIGGIETHVHLCVTVPPTLLVSEWVGQLKGSSSHEANQKLGHKVLDWQAGYGVVSFGTKDLEWVKRYVRNQKEHHATGTLEPRLERIEYLEPQAAPAEPREAP